MSAMQVADRDDEPDFGYRSVSRSRGRPPISDLRDQADDRDDRDSNNGMDNDDEEQQQQQQQTVVVQEFADELGRCGVVGLDANSARTLLCLLKKRFPGYDYSNGEWERCARAS
jgi:hypothetical protein